MFVSDTAYDSFMGRFSRRLAPVFADFAGVGAGQRVVDVGAGTGALTAELAQRGAETAAAEPSAAFVAALRARFPGVDVQEAAAEELPWPDESFDAALAQLVVTFMSDAPAGLAEMRRVVRPGGTVAVCMWDRDGMEMLAAIDRTRDALVARFAENPPCALGERLALELHERLRRAEPRARAAHQQDPGQTIRHGSV